MSEVVSEVKYICDNSVELVVLVIDVKLVKIRLT